MISSIIQADSPQNFRAKRMKGWDFFSGTSFSPSRSSRVAASALESPISRFEVLVEAVALVASRSGCLGDGSA